MAASAKWFGLTVQALFGASPTGFPIDWVNDEVRVSLHAGTVPSATDQDTWNYFDDCSASELATAGGYDAGGKEITTRTLTYDSSSNTVRLKGDPVAWTNATLSSTWASIRKYDVTPGSAPLMAYVDFGGTQTVSAGTFQITPDVTDGYLRAVVA